MSNVASEAAAGVVGDLLSELAPYAGDADEAGTTPEQPTGGAAQDDAHEAFTLDPVLPDDLQALLEEAEEPILDEDEEEDEEPVAAQTDEYEDEDVQRLRRQLAKEVKRREHAEKLRLTDNRKKWGAEAKKYFPLSQPASIQATSHRAFLREAAKQHTNLKPVFEEAMAAREATLRKEAGEAWGKPMTGPGAAVPDTQAMTDRVQAARDRGSFKDTIKEMLASGQVRL